MDKKLVEHTADEDALQIQRHGVAEVAHAAAKVVEQVGEHAVKGRHVRQGEYAAFNGAEVVDAAGGVEEDDQSPPLAEMAAKILEPDGDDRADKVDDDRAADEQRIGRLDVVLRVYVGCCTVQDHHDDHDEQGRHKLGDFLGLGQRELAEQLLYERVRFHGLLC